MLHPLLRDKSGEEALRAALCKLFRARCRQRTHPGDPLPVLTHCLRAPKPFRLRDHPVHLDEPSLIAFRHSFADCDKLMYRGEADDDTGFRFNCFNIEDAHDPEIGLEFGELVIPGSVLRRDVFDPVIGTFIFSPRGFSVSFAPS